VNQGYDNIHQRSRRVAALFCSMLEAICHRSALALDSRCPWPRFRFNTQRRNSSWRNRCARLFVEPVANRAGLRCCAVVVNEISELNLDADALLGTKLIHADDELFEMANGCICSLHSPHSPRGSFLNRRAAATDRGAQQQTSTTRALTARKRCRNNNTTADATTVCPLPAQRPLQINIPTFVGQHLNTRSGSPRVLLTPSGNAALPGSTWGRTDRLRSALPTRCGRGLSWNRRRGRRRNHRRRQRRRWRRRRPRRAPQRQVLMRRTKSC
jgi:hypothetical protein